MAPAIEGIILAAGLSRRMGCPKLELEVGGMTVLSRVVTEALASKLTRIVAVLPPAGIAGLRLDDRGERTGRFHRVVNPSPELGMSSSLHVGLSALNADVDAAMVVLGDQMGITAAVIDRLIDAFRNAPTSIVAPAIGGKRSTPVIFPADLFQDLRMETGDVGGRNVVNRRPERLVLVEMGAEYDDGDLDTPADFYAVTGLGRATEREE